MKVQMQELSRPVKVTVVVDAEELKKRKEKHFKSIQKNLPEIKGFRKGKIPRKEAEQHFGEEKIYKTVVDDIYQEVADEKNIVSARNSSFTFYGDLKNDTVPLTIEFVAELEPKAKIPELNTLKVDLPGLSVVTEKEIQDSLEKALEENIQLVDVEHKNLKNLDIAIIDYKGTLEGEDEPFKGGSANNFQLNINLEKRTFIDNFEEQMIGMKKDEERTINVKFPDDYRDKSKAGKRALFVVRLNNIKKKIKLDLDDSFAQSRGYINLNDYKETIRENIEEHNRREYEDNFKRAIVLQLLKDTFFEPIPLDMIEQQLEREWQGFLQRIGKTQEEYLKEQPEGKDYFKKNSYSNAEELLKTTILLKTIATEHKITVNKEEVKSYVLKITNAFGKDDQYKEKAIQQLEDKQIYNLHEKGAINEKVVDFLIRYFKENVTDTKTN